MLRRPGFEQTAIEMVTLDELVPPDHLLRKIDAVVDFSFIHDLTAPLYCADNGRPPLDPTLAVASHGSTPTVIRITTDVASLSPSDAGAS